MSNPNHVTGPFEPGKHIIPPPRSSSPATAEYRLNHLMLRIKNPEESLKFYNDCFGLHTIFVFNAGPWTIYYLGPRDVGMAELGTSKGLLELYHVPADSDLTYSNGNDYSKPGVGFGHIGFTIPDVSAALKRMEEFGYKIIKPLNQAKVTQMGMPESVKEADVMEGYRHVFRQLAFVQDPDGYWVEIVPQVVKPSSSN
ncbi:Glyoxalase/Bleomycin resistance protein/Dihydroxybiphenyl dioxygenase [Clohesyomyces aquaticus]|uniref:Glyoxalase/Bleomycin resistance protein/Dihydroxybiphenyl dioxygenase n=1 Tax=Clohesyomyces aquaticus TaxID=1231657 RepID=A0A1Y1ZPW4_9PLEO|nr:Glyoxalase/Bleomycin resistance protein/Dihydroxybiphenyl dioxygenase [Clohesyomyces aquaticus]